MGKFKVNERVIYNSSVSWEKSFYAVIKEALSKDCYKIQLVSDTTYNNACCPLRWEPRVVKYDELEKDTFYK